MTDLPFGRDIAQTLLPVQAAGKPADPTVVVVVPVFKHSVFVTESIFSVLEQEAPFRIATIIVDDGCPFPETANIGMALAAANPDVVYVRKPNGGLSSARNFGIDYALKRYPGLRAIYFLDSDNRLSPATLASCYEMLDVAHGVGWIYPNIDKFGVEWCGNFTGPYSRLLHVVHDNICEAGSMVAREVIDTGVRFDENMKAGCEDWEFWLQCLDAGYVGKNNPFFGFEYRMRGESMVTDTARDISGIREYMRKKHAQLHAYPRLVEYEDAEAPRFACLNPGSGDAVLFTDPTHKARVITHDEALGMMFAGQMEADSVGFPEILTWFKPESLRVLTELRLVWSLFNVIEKQVHHANFVAIAFEYSESSLAFEISEVNANAPLKGRVHGWATRQRLLQEVLGDPSRDWVLSLKDPVPQPRVVLIKVRAPLPKTVLSKLALPVTLALLPTLDAADELAAQFTERQRWAWREACLPQMSTRARLIEKMVGAEYIMPRVPSRQRLNVAVALPIAAYGGVERVAFAIAKVLKEAGCSVHLYCFGDSEMKLFKNQGVVFDSVNFFAEKDYRLSGGSRRFMGHDLRLEYDENAYTRRILGLLSGTDVLINCHVAPLNAAIGQLRRAGVKIINHLHVLDRASSGRPVGHPYIGLGFEHAHDLFLTCSRALRDWLHGLGVPLQKTMFIENAGGYMPGPELLAEMEEKRQARKAEGSLKALFVGRLDTQKGVERLERAIAATGELGLDIKWRVIGSEIVAEKATSWTGRLAALGVTLEPPLYDSAALSEAFIDADVFVLPSRWEGAPLAIIEAQRLGCVPIATDVGAVNELIDDGTDGVLLADGADSQVAADLTAALEALEADRSLLRQMSDAAIARGHRTRWETSCEPLLAQLRQWFPEKVSGRRGDAPRKGVA